MADNTKKNTTTKLFYVQTKKKQLLKQAPLKVNSDLGSNQP